MLACHQAAFNAIGLLGVQEIDRRNKEREIININMSPKVLESAVSK